MSRQHSYLNSARAIIELYKGNEPLASYLKKYFSQHKKYGAKDRRVIGHLCYSFYRLGKAVRELPADERIILGLFLNSPTQNEMLDALAPVWNENAGQAIAEKLKLTGIDSLDIFPWSSLLSNSIDEKMFAQSFLLQPELFIRVRPGKEQVVKVKLDKAGMHYGEPVQNCLVLPNTSKVDTIIQLNEEAVVQDYNSQRVGEFIRVGQTGTVRGAKKAWDCCAASGGKSIMAFDLDPTIDLTVSDIRESILANLKKRFAEAGIRKYKAFPIDLSIPISPLTTHDSQLTIPGSPFDLIICDVPCTGSGTWGRTPEQLYYFEKNTIDEYVRLQRKIISNTIPHLQKDGYFLYVTCSVFKKENEEQVDFIREKFGLEIKRMEVLAGYEMKADTLFAALLFKPS